MLHLCVLKLLYFEIATTIANVQACRIPRHSTFVENIVPWTVPSPPSPGPVEKRNNFELGSPMILHNS
jgi:hypothetical protein